MNSVVSDIEEVFAEYFDFVRQHYCDGCRASSGSQSEHNCIRYYSIFQGLALESLLFDSYLRFDDYMRLGIHLGIFRN